MADSLPKFKSPPVVETVLSIQFAKLPNLTAAHAGWFWKKYLPEVGGEWPTANGAPYLADVFERFGDQVLWGPRFGIQLSGGFPIDERMQFIRSDEERMIQVQDNRLILNWQKKKNEYPSYGSLLPEFKAALECFERFARDLGHTQLQYNQWEVTYVNVITRGDDLWKSEDDLQRVFKSDLLPAIPAAIGNREFINSSLRYVLSANRGRIHLTVTNGRNAVNQDVLRFQFDARGPVEEGDRDLDKYFDLGHGAIVQSFASLTTDIAHKKWQRTQ